MAQQFTKEQMQAARNADIYGYLLTYHSKDVIREGRSLRLRTNHGVVVRKDVPVYKDFSGDTWGNPVDLLTKYLGYPIADAVNALSGRYGRAVPDPAPSRREEAPSGVGHIRLPNAEDGPFRRVYAYLSRRGISPETIRMLINRKLLYQSADHSNCVFVTPERDFAEERGTNTYRPFHAIPEGARHDGFWYFKPHPGKTDGVVVCEAAIDAISAYELDKLKHRPGNYVYVSIAGVSKQAAIDRIKKHLPVIIAVDNDAAGQGCRDRNPECAVRIPHHKDWNEDLAAYRSRVRNKTIVDL